MPQPVRHTFDRVKATARMKAAGKSYADIARPLGMTRQAVGHWFRGRGEPDVQQMKSMAQTLGCHWLELVDEETTVVFQQSERERLGRIRRLSPEALAKLDDFLDVAAPDADG